MPFRIALFAVLAFIISVSSASQAIGAQSARHIYDELDRLKSTQYEDGTVISYDYDKVGNRTAKSTSMGQMPNTFTITATTSGCGSIVPSGAINVAQGNSQTFFIEQEGTLTSLLVDNVAVDLGTLQSAQGPFGLRYFYTFANVAGNHTVTANFATISHTITTTAGSGGTITPSSATVNYGGSQTFTITPNTGYNILDVKVDGFSQGAIPSYTFTNVIANHTISADFAFTPLPVANFSATPTTAAAPVLVSFTDQSQRATSWLWSFGDGTTSTLQNPTHVYKSAGNYSVTLTATNVAGSNSLTKSNYLVLTTCPNSPVRIVGKSPTYTTLQGAYNAAADGDTIQSQAQTFVEDLAANRSISVTIYGGYTCDYSSNPDKSVLRGAPAIYGGTVKMEYFQIQQ